jgi:hypothetical protein
LAGGSEKEISAGRETMKVAVIGLVIVLTGWLIIGEVLQILTGSGPSIPWNQVICQ